MKKTSRLEFLKEAVAISAGACCLGAINFFESCSTSKKVTIEIKETADMVSFSASSFADRTFITIPTKKFVEPIFIGKQSDGSYIALRMYCPHKGCAVNVTPEKLVCPCHGSEFSMNGSVLKGPSTDPLQSFRVSTGNQSVTVHFNQNG